ncbi:hypothetical protein CMMCAS05_05680 [Clavibacter michiganensis subsp. michiganensis]|nr:hypothetical protein CMMCAS05_05680 [Clavibacter michiganensis subsp. michiganensis]
MPPYTSSLSTMRSPGRVIARSSVSSAASPEANENACFPFSSDASSSCRPVRVGLALRAYS